jgi:hypothetical protein
LERVHGRSAPRQFHAKHRGARPVFVRRSARNFMSLISSRGVFVGFRGQTCFADFNAGPDKFSRRVRDFFFWCYADSVPVRARPRRGMRAALGFV